MAGEGTGGFCGNDCGRIKNDDGVRNGNLITSDWVAVICDDVSWLFLDRKGENCYTMYNNCLYKSIFFCLPTDSS